MISEPFIEELMREMYENFFIIKMINPAHWYCPDLHRSWYYHELKPEPVICGVVWTPHLQLAHRFHNERTVEEFKAKFITPRKVEILRIKRDS